MPQPLTVWRSPEHSALLSRRIKDGWARIKAGEGFLYIAEIAPDLIKIGHALDPDRRLIEMGMGNQKRLLGVMRAPRSVETALHRALRAHRLPEHGREMYPPSILSHPAIPAELWSAP